MGWMFGEEHGRPIGYGVEAECDEPGCTEQIDRGLGYKCGGVEALHTPDGDEGCGGYFCEKHRTQEHTGRFGLCRWYIEQFERDDEEDDGDEEA